MTPLSLNIVQEKLILDIFFAGKAEKSERQIMVCHRWKGSYFLNRPYAS